MKELLIKIWSWISLKIIANVQWNSFMSLFNKGIYWDLTESEQDHIRKLITKDHFIILTRRKTHLTTYLISLGHFIKTGRFGYWSHALMNLENDVKTDTDFRLMEATGVGTHYSSFLQVFDCDSVVLLKPKGFTVEDWTEALDCLRAQEGKLYDCIFDLKNDKELSCIELVYWALKNDWTKLPGIVKAVRKYKNLDPQMLFDSGDFDVVFEARH